MRLALVDVVNKQRNNNNSSSRRRSQSNLPFPFHFLHSIHNNTLLLLLFFFFTFMVKLSHLVFRVQMKWLIVLRWLWVKLNCEMFCVSCVWLQWNSCARILWMKTPTQTHKRTPEHTKPFPLVAPSLSLLFSIWVIFPPLSRKFNFQKIGVNNWYAICGL